MKTTVNGLYNLLSSEIGDNKTTDTLYYFKSIFADDIDNLVRVRPLHFPFINIESDGMSIEYNICPVEGRRTVTANIYIGFLSGSGVNVQLGSTERNKIGYLEAVDSIITILENNIQYTGYWIRGTVTNVSKLSTEIGTNIVKGAIIEFTVERQ